MTDQNLIKRCDGVNFKVFSEMDKGTCIISLTGEKIIWHCVDYLDGEGQDAMYIIFYETEKVRHYKIRNYTVIDNIISGFDYFNTLAIMSSKNKAFWEDYSRVNDYEDVFFKVFSIDEKEIPIIYLKEKCIKKYKISMLENGLYLIVYMIKNSSEDFVYAVSDENQNKNKKGQLNKLVRMRNKKKLDDHVEKYFEYLA